MQALDSDLQPFATTTVMWSLVRHGGSLRIAPLLERSGLSVDDLCTALNELAQRRWLEVTWRRAPRMTLPERLRCVDRITATRYGRARLPPPKAKPRDRRDRTHPWPTSKGWRCHACGNIVA